MLRFLFKSILWIVLAAIVAPFVFFAAAFVRESDTAAKLVGASDLTQSDASAGGFIETDAGRFFTFAAGPADAAPVLLAHGTAAWSGFWAHEVEALGKAGHRAIAFDMPPFGLSDRPAGGDYSRTAQAARILALVATFETKPIMVAHSFGAAAATEAVLQDPSAFAGLVIVNGALGLNPDRQQAELPLPLRSKLVRQVAVASTATNPLATKWLLRGMLHNKDAATPEVVEVLQYPQTRGGNTRTYADWLPSLLAPAADSLSREPASYANLPLPVRIIWGDHDTITPPDQAEALAKAVGQGEVIYLKNVGHIPHIEAPEPFLQALQTVLAEMR